MSQHSQRTQQGPSWASIFTGAALVFVAIGFSTWIVYSPELTWREVAGAAGWSILAWVLTAQVVSRIVDRKVAEDRARRAEARQRADRERDTGTWEGDAGEKLTIRYEPATGRYLAEGWISDHWQIHPETEWSDRATLVQTLRELERSGEMAPWDDEGTRAIRARLDIDPESDGYPQGVETGPSPADTVVSLPVPVRPRLADEDDETRRIGWPVHGPSKAALTPINVPVFRSETERAAWAAEHEIPTEFLPKP